MRLIRQQVRLLFLGIAVATLSCTNGDHVMAPVVKASSTTTSGITVADNGGCAATCVLFNTTAPLWSAIANPDSSAIPVPIAEIRYAPSMGDSVLLQLHGDSAGISGISPDETVDVTDSKVHVRVSLRALTSPSTVWKFSSADSTTLNVTLNRALVAGISGRLVLTMTNLTTVVRASRPWLAPAANPMALRPSVIRSPFTNTVNDLTPICGANAIPIFQTGSVCGINVTFSQSAPADAFLGAGATFQSNSGHGVSNPITITFNQPVGSVTVTAYDPTFDGDSIAAFTADGTVIGTAEFPGNHHPGMLTTQTRTLTGSISSVVLTPAPLDYVAYSMTVGVSLPTLNVACTPAEPLRGTEVHCVASMSDSSLYVLSRLRSSTSGGTTVVDQTIMPSAPKALYDWNGLAATETHVEVFGSRDGVIVSAATTFGISQRTTFQDAIQPEMPPQLQGNGLPTMGTVYPGLHSTPNGWEIEMGGLGRTWHLFPDYDLRIIPSGPNTNLVFAENFRWEDSKPLRENSPIPSGTYLSVALFPGDPFYGLQDGRNGNCSASQVNILRDEMYQHELIHYGSAIQIRKQLKLHQFYESKLALSGNGAISHAIEVAFFLPTRQYNLGVKASDAGIDADSTTIARTSLTCQMRFP